MNPVLETRDLGRRFGERWAVRGLRLRIERGEVVGLLGPNGAGKSTSLQLIAGVLPPTEGEVRLGGVALTGLAVAERRRIGYLPEEPPLHPELRVDEFLGYSARLHRVPPRGVAAALARAKALCGLEHDGGRLIGTLSKGLRQRVGLAQALLHRPELVILDEPTVGLDPLQIQQVRGLIAAISTEAAVILSSHLLDEVQRLCNRVVLLHRGAAVHEGPTATGAAVTVVCRFARDPGADALGAITGVTLVTRLDGGRCRLRLDPSVPYATVAQALVAAPWGVLELTPERESLEQLFHRTIVAGEAR